MHFLKKLLLLNTLRASTHALQRTDDPKQLLLWEDIYVIKQGASSGKLSSVPLSTESTMVTHALSAFTLHCYFFFFSLPFPVSHTALCSTQF